MEILETERLIYELLPIATIDSLAAIDQDPAVCQFLPAIGNRATTAAGIQGIIMYYHQYGVLFNV